MGQPGPGRFPRRSPGAIVAMCWRVPRPRDTLDRVKLYHTGETPAPDHGMETVVKEGRLVRIVRPLVFLVLTVGLGGVAAYVAAIWLTDSVPEQLDGVPLLPFFLAGSIFGLVFYSLLRTSFRRSNWLLRVRPDGLVIKLRSDTNAHLPEPHPVVAAIPYAEISSVRATHEWVRQQSLSTSGGSAQYRAHFLDLELRMSGDELRRLRQAIDTEIAHRPKGKTLTHHYPVRLDGDVLRIEWWGALRPRFEGAMQLLARHVTVRRDHDTTVDLRTPAEPDEAASKALELARRGQQITAVALLRRAHGLSLAAAKARVEELLKRSA